MQSPEVAMHIPTCNRTRDMRPPSAQLYLDAGDLRLALTSTCARSHIPHIPTMASPSAKHVDLLILGAGWTSTFLIPLCTEQRVTYAATSRPSHPQPDTIPFEFDDKDESPDPTLFAALPSAKTVLITFPITAKGGSERLVKLYKDTHHDALPGFIQLGSSGIWEVRGRS